MIRLLFFLTTKGHHGKFDLYKVTLNRLRQQIDFGGFKKYLSIKVFPGDEARFKQIIKDFEDFEIIRWDSEDQRIKDESPFKDYAYYLLTNYLADITRTYLKIGAKEEYTFICEDDSPIIEKESTVNDFIPQAIKALQDDWNLFSVHLRRECFPSDPNYLAGGYKQGDTFTEPHDNNFQNQVFRTRDMIKVAQIIAGDYRNLMQVHTERAVQISILRSNPNFKHISWNPNLAHSIHIGVPDYENWIKAFSL